MNYSKSHFKKFILFSLFTFIAIFYSTLEVSADSASLYIVKPSTSAIVGDRITVEVKVRSTGQSINAVSGAVTFSSDVLRVVSVSKERSIINLWTREPTIQRNSINFEGIVLNPGYTGTDGAIFYITFQAQKQGTATVGFREGAVLANDGQGTNVLGAMNPATLVVAPGQTINEQYPLLTPAPTQALVPVSITPGKQVALPVITEYSQSVLSPQSIFIKGKGEPNALTKIVFQDTTQKSIGEQFVEYAQTKKKKLSDVFVNNDSQGAFSYVSSANLVAGAYNATPFLVDANKNTEKPGLGVQLLVSDSKIVRYLVVLINILGLLIPVVGLIVIIYFIPWYSWLRMRILKKKLGLEEEKIEITEHQMKLQQKLADKEVSHSQSTTYTG